MFYSVDRRGLYQTGGTLDLSQLDPLGRPLWGLPDWFEADDLRAHVAELFPDGLSLHGWQYMVERHDFIRPTDSNALFVHHNMVVELVFEYVRRAASPRAVLDFNRSLHGNRSRRHRHSAKRGRCSTGLKQGPSFVRTRVG